MLKSLFLAAAALCATGAGAAVQTVRFQIAATNFVDNNGFGRVAPTAAVTGTFTITFDDAADVLRQTTGISVTGFNLPYAGTIGFSYSAFFDGLSVGIETDPGGYTVNNNEFGFYVDQPVANPNGSPRDFTYADNVTSYDARSFTVTRVAAAAAAVPEPATWALMVAGFGFVGASLRRVRRWPAVAGA